MVGVILLDAVVTRYPVVAIVNVLRVGRQLSDLLALAASHALSLV